jgi:hypothetical protein
LEKGSRTERRILQILILLAAGVPVIGGATGAVMGESAFGAWAGAGEDSQMRYLSGLLLAIGLVFWGCIPWIERRGEIMRVLTLIVMTGGLARLSGMVLIGDPGRLRWALVMELLVAPLLCLWQARLARSG